MADSNHHPERGHLGSDMILMEQIKYSFAKLDIKPVTFPGCQGRNRVRGGALGREGELRGGDDDHHSDHQGALLRRGPREEQVRARMQCPGQWRA